MSDDRQDSWSGNWVSEKIIKHDKVGTIELVNPNLLTVITQDDSRYKIATMSLASINRNDLELLIGDVEVDFVLNVSKEPYLSSDAIDFSLKRGFSIGGLGDLMRALRDKNLSNYINPEITFILRGLKQHTRVSRVTRMDNRRFNVERIGLPSVIIVALNDYDLNADSVRTALDVFKDFDAILTSNPSCRQSGNSISAAESAGKKILSWGDLLSELNRTWN